MKSILVVGNFGYKNNQIDGQTVKTRLIFSSFDELAQYELKYVDVSELLKLSNIVNVFKFFTFDHVIFLPGKNQLGFLLSIIKIIKFISKAKFHYIVIGGWLYDYISQSKRKIKALSFFDSISCESDEMVFDLSTLNIKSEVMHNFRKRYNVSFTPRNNQKNIRFYFFARIINEKGVFLAIDLVQKMIDEGFNCSLDIYGPFLLDANQKVDFNSRLTNKIKYKGLLDNDSELHDKLSKYDILLFPSFYDGEGLPGTLIDAKFSRTVPVVSNWKYNSEYIEDNISGLVIDLDNFVVDAFERLKPLLLNEIELQKLKEKSFQSSFIYSQDVVINQWNSKNIK